MAGGFEFKFDAKKLEDIVDKAFEGKVTAAMRVYAESAAVMLESYMKENRPWTDRTGAAKARLSAAVQDVPDGLRIALSHGVDYGIWLELANEKRFAIIQPTIKLKGNEVMEGFDKLLDKSG